MRNFIHYRNILMITLWFILSSQRLYATLTNPYIINFSRSDYKASSKNWNVAEDENGIMYFANNSGLLESDGLEWKKFQIPSSPLIRSIGVKNHNIIFSGGNGSFGVWERDHTGTLRYESLTPLLQREMESSESIWRIHVNDSIVYFQSFSHIYRYNGSSIQTISLKHGFLFLEKVRDEYIVQNIEGSLYKLNDDKLVRIEGSEVFNEKIVRVILPYSTDSHLIGTSEGRIYVYDNHQYRLLNPTLTSKLRGLELNCGVYSRKRNTYLLGTQLKGIFEIDNLGNVINNFNSDNTLQNNTILNLYEDSKQNIWSALDKGLSYIMLFNDLSFFGFDKKNSKTIYDAIMWNNNCYFATNQGIFHVSFDVLNSSFYNPSDIKLIPGSQGQAWSLEALDGRLFCCHNNGILEVNKNNEVKKVFNIDEGTYTLHDFYFNRKRLAMVIGYKNIMIIDIASSKMKTIRNVPSQIYKSSIDELGDIWLETYNKGVYRCRLNDTCEEFQYVNYYGNSKQPEIPEKLQLCKLGKRMYFLGDNQFYVYNQGRDQLESMPILNEAFSCIKEIKNVITKNDNELWILTDISIYKCGFDGYNAEIQEAYRIDIDNNISLVTFSENISILNDSISIICNDDGFIIHKSQEGNQRSREIFEKPLIQKIRTFNYHTLQSNCIHSHEGKEHIYIPYTNNSIHVDTQIPHGFAESLQMEYYLSGIDKVWNSPTKNNTITYYRLPSGHYQLHIRSTNLLGEYSDERIIQFEIGKPWYQTLWWYSFCTLSVFLSLYLVIIVYKRRLKKKHRIELKVLEKKLLENENEQLQLKIEQSRAKMLTQTSLIMQKNDILLKIKKSIEEICEKNPKQSLKPLFRQINLLIAQDINSEEDWKTFLMVFEEKHPNFFKELQLLNPELTDNDLRLCACLKLNMNTKDIASLMNLSTRAVENNRYRIRKKLKLDTSDNLNEYFISFE